MAVHFIQDFDHPLLAPYRDLRNRNWTERSGSFIAEGPLLAERLLHSTYGVHSVLVETKLAGQYQSSISANTDLIVVDHELVEGLVGFNFHRGVLACGFRKSIPLVNELFVQPLDRSEVLAMAVGIQDPENLGGIIRTCSALGIQNVIIGPGTADPLSRRVLRVSMGSALRVQLSRSRDVIADLDHLRRVADVEVCATSLQEPCESLETATKNRATLVLMGNERHGLPPEIQTSADRRIRIDMELGTDSLNVCVASGIVLHHFRRVARPT